MSVGAVLAVLLVLIYVGGALLVARWAARKGHSFAGYLLLGLIISPVISLIVAGLVGDKRIPQTVTVAPGPNDHLDQLQKAVQLHESGALTDEQFEAERQRILGSRA